MAISGIGEVLNTWARLDVFTLVIPFLLIFAIVFAILQKTKILGDNRAIHAVIALSLGLLSIQFGFVSDFFRELFPKFGIGLAVFLVLVIMIGFFYTEGEDGKIPGAVKWVGWFVGIGVVIWAIANWEYWEMAGRFSIGQWFEENFWPLIIFAGLIALVVLIGSSGKIAKSPIKRVEQRE